MNSNIINAGVEAVNKSRASVVEAKAQDLISKIMNNRKSIEAYEPLIKAEQDSMNKLALDTITAADMFGSQPTGEPNQNQVTILNAIKKMNDARQQNVELSSQSLINKIEGYRKTQNSLQVQIAEWQKQLRELSVDVVTTESVLA